MQINKTHITVSALVLTALLSTAAPGQVLINECYLGGTDWFELVNAGPTPVNLSGHQILFSGDATGGPVTGSTTFGSITLAPGDLVVVTEDSQLNFPAVPAGVQKIAFGGNIWWSGFASGFGGTCTLTDGATGLDTVNWGNPANANPVPPASFNPSITSLSGDHVFRTDTALPSTPADWSSSAAGTPGQLNPGQQVGVGPIVLDLLAPSPGAIDITVTTNPPVPGGEIYNFLSLVDMQPNGSGPLFGLAMDAFPQVFTAISPAGPFHTLLDGNGTWTASFPTGVPAGLHIEGVSILVQGISVTRISSIRELDT